MHNVVILRGIVGAGKSTLAEKLINNFVGYTKIFSADHYFTKTGTYIFAPNKLNEAHNECFLNYLDHLDYCRKHLKNALLIVDNTNISAFEFAPYYRLAEIHGYNVKIITVKCDPTVGFNRNIHGVPFKTALNMAQRLDKEFIPPWWNHETV